MLNEEQLRELSQRLPFMTRWEKDAAIEQMDKDVRIYEIMFDQDEIAERAVQAHRAGKLTDKQMKEFWIKMERELNELIDEK